MVVAAFSGEHFRYARRMARIFGVYNLRKNMENHINNQTLLISQRKIKIQ